jgi:hypothetical protein
LRTKNIEALNKWSEFKINRTKAIKNYVFASKEYKKREARIDVFLKHFMVHTVVKSVIKGIFKYKYEKRYKAIGK